MKISIDHVAVPVRDPSRAARFLAELLGLDPAAIAGPEGEMRLLPVGGSGALLFAPSDSPTSLHIAFRVDEPTFAGVVDRLRSQGVEFGNDPEDPANGRTDDTFGGKGRIYFADPDGHFFEVIA
jgi:catechol 2,3-dioxygenase-like lactoylglutathione lyase family enzyme